MSSTVVWQRPTSPATFLRWLFGTFLAEIVIPSIIFILTLWTFSYYQIKDIGWYSGAKTLRKIVLTFQKALKNKTYPTIPSLTAVVAASTATIAVLLVNLTTLCDKEQVHHLTGVFSVMDVCQRKRRFVFASVLNSGPFSHLLLYSSVWMGRCRVYRVFFLYSHTSIFHTGSNES